ncbi:hypothetical protein PLICRDRAFT_46512 [Plicaturopsis crispa FD-325 SS-3]|uniref:Uncharacterized protein n=1 Tax=Plicaturopsis crispa FD-325 SS-3 TaxID=944288 RepID=A0A0C9SX55_PLICR|nr:hypothetical protein PLICRDRAFT_46512 [Plicaturopsis crispa FD-325 SS-3]
MVPPMPMLCWMLSLNRDYTREEYNQCYEIVRLCAPHCQVRYNPHDAESFRVLLAHMIPLLMMRHRRVPRERWRDRVTENGKHWIEQSPDSMPPERLIHSMIGYHITWEQSMAGMVMTQGRERQVINIGLGIKQVLVEPKGTPVGAYVQSLAHKLTARELSHLSEEISDDHIMRRLCILLALKSAYINAVGQPVGFDWSRLEFNIPEQTVSGDEQPLSGWEFRIFKASLGVVRGEGAIEEEYQCATAFFRASQETTFIWDATREDVERWVQFLNIDQMIKVIPKLTA